MAKHRHSKRRTRRMRGGDCGASQHAINTYGGIGQQHASSVGGNVIGMNSGTPAAAPIVGGSALSHSPYKGGRRSRRTRRSRKSRR